MSAAALPEWPSQGADALERALLETWRDEGLFRRTLEATAAGEPFVFFEGPPTANGRPGLHHVFARTIKDLVCRFRAMQGRRVTRVAGWDTHGLPVEIEVEKELQLSGKREIERYGVAAFNARARASVFRYKAEWEQLSDRIGYWLDYDRPYVTCAPEYVESVWAILKRLHERDLLYRGHRVLPYCPRCGTVLSSHELALGYETITTNSVYVTFPLRDEPDRQLVVWTTTPWTLVSNAAIAVSPTLEYVEVDDPRAPGRTLVVAAARAAAVAALLKAPAPEPRRRFAGAALVGRAYLRPFEVVALPEGRAREVVAADFVTAEDGSGLVHLAPAFGADDYAAGREHGLAFVRPVGADGAFTGTTWPELEGRRVTDRETTELLVRQLKADGRWLASQPYEHSYPHCWRCRSKLIYYARESWFVRTSAVKARMLAGNAAVRWHPPEVGSGRFGEWLENNVDWALSRDRYWGTPLPVWVSDRDPDHVEVIGSFAELAGRLGRPLPADFDPHKPAVDALAWPAPDGGTMRRVPEVIDTWFDSGAMPYAQWHWPFEHAAEFASHFPADFICEGLDQTRGWFYSLLAIGAAAFDAAPYRNVLVNGLVLDAEGQKMSKSRGNAVDPHALIAEHGADAVRLYLLASGQVWLPKRFDARQIPEVAGGFLNTLRNTYQFLALYAGPDGGLGAGAPAWADRPLIDRWLGSRLDATAAAVTAAWEGYDVTGGVRAVMDFVDDLSNWYVRRCRPRFWQPGREADPAAVATLREALVWTARLLAPAAPFAADWLHRALGEGSVHLARLPVPAGRRDPGLEAAMEAVRRLASLGRAAREERGIGVRQPLAVLKVAMPAAVLAGFPAELFGVLGDEVNVKRIEPVTSDAELVRVRGRPNFRALGKRFGKATPAVAQAVEGLPGTLLRALEAGETVTLPPDLAAPLPAGVPAPVTIGPDDCTVVREVLGDWPVASDGPYVAALDPALDDALRAEGLAREVVNRVQRLRKDAGYQVQTRIRLWVDGPAPLAEAVRAHGAMIREETLALALEAGPAATADLAAEVTIGAYAATIAVRRADDVGAAA